MQVLRPLPIQIVDHVRNVISSATLFYYRGFFQTIDPTSNSKETIVLSKYLISLYNMCGEGLERGNSYRKISNQLHLCDVWNTNSNPSF